MPSTCHSSNRKIKTSISCSSLHLRPDIDRSVKQARKEIRAIVESCLSGRGNFLYGDKTVGVTPLDFPRMLSEWRRETLLDHALRNILISSFFSSEAKMGGSGLIAAMLWSADEFEEVDSIRFSRRSDVEGVIKSWQSSGVSASIARTIFAMGSSGCHVALEEGEQFGTVVSCLEGMRQSGHIDNLMAANLPQGFALEGQAFLVAVDGIVESVGQIHHLLEASEGQPLILMARAFLPDVTNTLAANYPDKLQCLPFVVENWAAEEFLSMEKMGVACVTNETGGQISDVKLLQKAEVSAGLSEIIIKSQKASKRKITVSFGSDLGSVKGLCKDRVKTLLALSRFTSRTGCTNIRCDGEKIVVPNSSLLAAKRALESLRNALDDLGAVIVHRNREKNNGKSKKQSSSSGQYRIRRQSVSSHH